MEITRKGIYKGINIAIVVYGLGLLSQFFFGDINNSSVQAEKYLKGRNEEITRNIERYNQNISIAGEPFLSQYKDSLENAVRDRTVLGKEIKIAEEEASRTKRKAFSSWAGFFID